jgi:DNA (cytosine-5)-methyltransferase 1
MANRANAVVQTVTADGQLMVGFPAPKGATQKRPREGLLIMRRLLDLFCGAGGAAMGYARAGFEVVGVDVADQPNYPFEFWHMDALAVHYEQLWAFDAIHASPPCQAYTTITASARRRGIIYPDLFPRVKAMLVASGLPFIIENVPGSPARNCLKLCGTMFGLGVFRHRLFETNFPVHLPPTHCSCYRKNIGRNGYVTVAGDSCRKSEGLTAMQIDWKMSKEELNEAIPPAYTEFLGRQLMSILGKPSGANEHLVLTSDWRKHKSQRASQLPLAW